MNTQRRRRGKDLHSTIDLGKITVGDLVRRLVADTKLEAGGAPVDELDGALGLESGNGSMGIVGHDITAVEQASGHVLSAAGVALDHLVVGLEARHGHLLDRVGLVGRLSCRDDGSIRHQGEVDAGIGDQVGLELVQVDVQRAVEAERGGDGRDHYASVRRHEEGPEAQRGGVLLLFLLTLGNQTVQVLEVGTLEAEVAAADVVDGLVVDHEGAVGVLEGGVGGQDRVVGLNDRGSRLGSRVDAELELALLAVVDRETLHQEGSETRTGATAEGVEDEETLETAAVVRDTADLVQDLVYQLLSDRVVTTGVVVGSILLASDHVLRVEEATVGAGADLIDDVRLEIAVDGSGNVFSLA